uniref:RRM domain-containing protein n=1 Tax=Strigamia maritima TaxID=126957 RepID=T1IK98_STRMM
MVKLTPMMMKKKKMEEALAAKEHEKIKLEFEDDDEGSDYMSADDDEVSSGYEIEDSETGDDDDEDEAPELVSMPPKKGAAKTPKKEQTSMKIDAQKRAKTPGKTPIKQETTIKLAKTPGKTPIKQETTIKLAKTPGKTLNKQETPMKLAKTLIGKTPIKGQTPATAKKPQQTPLQATKTPIKGSAKKTSKLAKLQMSLSEDELEIEIESEKEDDVTVKIEGKKRPAQNDDKTSPKKMKTMCDENDEIVRAQYERIEKTERERIGFGFNPLRLYVHGLARKATVEQLKEVFPTCVEIQVKNMKAFVTFSSAADAEKAFLASVDMDIKGKKMTVVYSHAEKGEKKAKLRKELVEKQFERSCKLEKNRIVGGLDKKQLIVKFLPKMTTADELETLFPKCTKANTNETYQEGFMRFSSEEDAKQAFDKGADLVINGGKVVVLYLSFKPRSAPKEKKILESIENGDSVAKPKNKRRRKRKGKGIAPGVVQEQVVAQSPKMKKEKVSVSPRKVLKPLKKAKQ